MNNRCSINTLLWKGTENSIGGDPAGFWSIVIILLVIGIGLALVAIWHQPIENYFSGFWSVVIVALATEIVLALLAAIWHEPVEGNPWVFGSIAVALVITLILAIITISKERQKSASEFATKEPNKSAMFISFSLLFISLAGWIWGAFWGGNFTLGVLGAGVFGGIVYDIVVNKGEYIVPKVEEDGISLGVIYGAVIGFITAIIVIDNALTHGNFNNLSLIDSTTTFLGAVGVKTSSEFAATQKLMAKKKASISFNLTDDQGNVVKHGDITSATKFKANGQIATNEKTIESQVVHLKFKNSDNKMTIWDIVTNDEAGKFEEGQGVPLEVGKWEAWASWDGNDTYSVAESIHRKFEVKS